MAPETLKCVYLQALCLRCSTTRTYRRFSSGQLALLVPTGSVPPPTMGRAEINAVAELQGLLGNIRKTWQAMAWMQELELASKKEEEQIRLVMALRIQRFWSVGRWSVSVSQSVGWLVGGLVD